MGMQKISAGLFLDSSFKKPKALKVKTMRSYQCVQTKICTFSLAFFSFAFPPSPPFPGKITVCMFCLAFVNGRFAENLNIAVSCFSFNFLCFEIPLFKC